MLLYEPRYVELPLLFRRLIHGVIDMGLSCVTVGTCCYREVSKRCLLSAEDTSNRGVRRDLLLTPLALPQKAAFVPLHRGE